MSNKVELETVRKKIKGLDNELDTFIEAMREIKEIRDTVVTLPEDLKQNRAEIEARKKEMDRLLSSSKNMLITFEEQARGLIFDLEKKTDTLATEAKLQISAIKDAARKSSNELLTLHKEKIKGIDGNYNELYNSLETIKKIVDSQNKSIDALKKSHLAHSDRFGNKNAVTIVSAVLIAGMVFAILSYFIQ